MLNKLKELLKNPLFSNVFYLSILQGVNYLLPFIALPFLFKKLGPEYYGLIAFSYSVALFLNILVDFGFELYSTREISINRENKTITDKIFSVTMVSKLCLLMSALIILIVLTASVEKFQVNSYVYFLMFFVVVGNYLSPVWYFQGMEKMKYVTIVNSAAKIISFTPMFIFIRSSDDLLYAAMFYAVGYFASGLLSLAIAFYQFEVRFIVPTLTEIKDSLAKSSHFFLSRATVSFYTTCNTVLIGLTFGNEMTGYYNIAEKLYQAFGSLINPLTQGLYPYMAKTRNVLLFKRILLSTMVGSFFVVGFIYVFAGELLFLLFDTRNDYSIGVLKILIIGGLAIIPSYLIGYPFLAAMGYTRFTNNTVILVGVNHIMWLVIMFWTQNITLFSISILIVMSEFLALILRFYGVWKYKLFRI